VTAVDITDIVGANNTNFVLAPKDVRAKSVSCIDLGKDVSTRKKAALTKAASCLKSAQDDARFWTTKVLRTEQWITFYQML
jgi:hypothetical protein